MAAKTAAGGRWEVVKKGRRSAAGNNNKARGGGDRRALGEANGVWKFDLTPPIQTTSTLYELGFEKIKKRQNKEQVPPPAAEPKKPANKKQPKKVAAVTNQNQKQGRFRSLEAAMKALDVAALQKELDKSQSVFSGNPSVWLKDLASYLNYKLQAPLSEPTLSQHTHGESLHGYRICIQAILQEKPKIATTNLSKFLELLRSHQSRPAKCLTIMWAIGQAGFASLSEGLKVWLGIMMPVLGIKSLSPYAIAYLERLLLMHPNLTKGFGMIGPKDFFPLLDFAYMPNNSLTPSLQEHLCQLYPRLKVLAFGAKPESTLHTYFPSFLSRATPSCPAEMKKELLSSLTECLTVDPLSASVWRQLYPKHLSQSSLLLDHLLKSQDRIPKKVWKSLLEIIQSFKLTNQELLRKSNCNNQDAVTCDAACKALLQQSRGPRLPWTRLFLLTLVFAAGFLCHDFRSHSSFQASVSGRLLQSSGFLPVGQQACAKLYSYSLQGYSWLEEAVPAWSSYLLTMVRPSLQTAWTHTNATVVFLSSHCAPHLAWFGDSLISLSKRIQTQLPDVLNQLLYSLKELLLLLYQNVLLPLWHLLLEGLARAQEHCHEVCRGEVTWQCLKTQLNEAAHWTWTYLQDSMVAFLDWALALISQQ
ncbi:PREDICTED: transmembrane protein 214 isoform X2 [Elephantulus edwardii]|uniref:transmembrane protein 214 isoform X2 n=1 Tax=Elephantulus edwardii TaxID=28737 RepID=UPI0003F068AB|nr:PREDICTED: transmembrane protein 214 isoform X2 [Elephantulus edwardii]